jgi:dTDP-4-dehydrorhamnose reductase
MKNTTPPVFFITGASGFVGSNLCRSLANRCTVTGAYYSHPITLAGCTMLPLDITNRTKVLTAVENARPTHIIHGAAISAPDFCENNPQTTWDLNYGGTEFVLEAAAAINCRMVFISTDLVFDGKQGHYAENDQTNPLNLYAKTKAAAEKLCLKNVKNCIVIRITLQYGIKAQNGPSFSDWILQRLSNKQQIPLFIDQFRTPCYIEDTARGLELAALHADPGELYHLTGPEKINRYAFAQKLAATYGFPEHLLKPCSMNDDPGCAPRPRDVSLCGNKFTAAFGYTPGDVQQGLNRMMKMQLSDKVMQTP